MDSNIAIPDPIRNPPSRRYSPREKKVTFSADSAMEKPFNSKMRGSARAMAPKA
jgi:hypothetical protein